LSRQKRGKATLFSAKMKYLAILQEDLNCFKEGGSYG